MYVTCNFTRSIIGSGTKRNIATYGMYVLTYFNAGSKESRWPICPYFPDAA